MPRVSVVIPLYQTERFIGQALNSVISQTFQDFEVIVVDDGSKDDGPAIAGNTGDPRIRVVSQKNRGLAGARNTGIRNATGEIIALLDADDIWNPRKLELHVAHLDRNPTVDVSFCASKLIDEEGEDVGLIQSPITRHFEDSDFLCRNPIGNGSVPVLRRAALDRIEFFDESRGWNCWFNEDFRQSEDIECWMRLKAGGGCTFAYIDKPLTLYRVNSGGLSANVDAQLASWHKFRDAVAKYAPEVVEKHGHRAEAYQLRFLARRAVRSDSRRTALQLMMKSLATHPGVIIEEPTRTISSLAAAVAKVALPDPTFARLQDSALQLASKNPGVRL